MGHGDFMNQCLQEIMRKQVGFLDVHPAQLLQHMFCDFSTCFIREGVCVWGWHGSQASGRKDVR